MADKEPPLKWQIPRESDRNEEKEKITDQVGPWRQIKAEARLGNYLKRVTLHEIVKDHEGKKIDKYFLKCWVCNSDQWHSARVFVPDRDHGPIRIRVATVCDTCGYVSQIRHLSERLKIRQPHQDEKTDQVLEGRKTHAPSGLEEKEPEIKKPRKPKPFRDDNPEHVYISSRLKRWMHGKRDRIKKENEQLKKQIEKEVKGTDKRSEKLRKLAFELREKGKRRYVKRKNK